MMKKEECIIMNNTTLYNEIDDLIGLGTEGDYWDFKKEWHDNKADLLHDIICMANNLVDRDAYIIIGVSDSKSPDGVQILGVPNVNRKSQQNLIDFFKDKKFAGNLRPTIYVQTLYYGMKEIDIVIIKNTSNTPYYLVEAFKYDKECVRSGHIYTRIGDTNTPKDSIADIDKIEYLWRKRFGIDRTVIEHLLQLLNTPDDWSGNFNSSQSKYHSVFPEFQIHYNEYDEEDHRKFENHCIIKNITDHLPDKGFSVCEISIKYHSTIIYTSNAVFLDGYRYLIPFPETQVIYMNDFLDYKHSLTYLYFDQSTIAGKLFNCLSNCDNPWYNQKWILCPGFAFFHFTDVSDKKAFNEYLEVKMPEVFSDYDKVLMQKGYTESGETQEYFLYGWSKANEIKSRFLYDKYRGFNSRPLDDYVPDLPRLERT